MTTSYFDGQQRFVIENFDSFPSFASFLPGIAGPLGIPMWAFYVNRGQAIASFGVQSKDTPIMEFQPANKAYQMVPYTGFRTFIKTQIGRATRYYEPFSALARPRPFRQMFIGANDLALEETSGEHGLRINVLYFTLPGEPFAALVRQVTVQNTSDRLAELEIVDGLPVVIPFGVNNALLKEMGRTVEAWMAVFNLETDIPFYRVQATVGDVAKVETFADGHFYLPFAEADDVTCSLLPIVDPAIVFGANTSLSYPDGFLASSLEELRRAQQITTCRTPCGMAGIATRLAPGATVTLVGLYGHVSDFALIERECPRLTQPAYIAAKHAEARALAEALTAPVATHTSNPHFDAYCRQSLLDNILRGGYPTEIGGQICHIYGRKHGDLERDYNAFYLAPEYYSQGNANYRDVNQNRRSDVWLYPTVGDFDVLAFLGLIQADGYNPLVVLGSQFSIPEDQRAPILELVDQAEAIGEALDKPFTPGSLLKAVSSGGAKTAVHPESLLGTVLSRAEPSFEAQSGEGYWIDHWSYNLDLIDAYLAIYPDKKDELLFGREVTFFDSPAVVLPRDRKYVIVVDENGSRVRQYGSVAEDEEKRALINGRQDQPNLMRRGHGHGEVYRTTVFAKLLTLGLLKFATLDPLGMGVEMEANKPGWCDALNGLPALFGSSLAETYELQRLLAFLSIAVTERPDTLIELPVEMTTLLYAVEACLVDYDIAADIERDLRYWDTVATAREAYRARTRLGFAGHNVATNLVALAPVVSAMERKVRAGVTRAEALTDGVPPTYFAFEVSDYEIVHDERGQQQRDVQGRPYVRAKRFELRALPPFLEGPVHALRVCPDQESARSLYQQVRASELFDRGLGMYKTNGSLASLSHEIGRLRAFTPGWLENESVFLHMAYKYLLATLRAGLYEEFFEDFRQGCVPFFEPGTYGRSTLENCSFIVSSAHPDETFHGRGFVARLTGATAEMLSMWSLMMAGDRPFVLRDGQLHLELQPSLPAWLFDENSCVQFTFLGRCMVTYQNPGRRDTFGGRAARPGFIRLVTTDGDELRLAGPVIGPPYADMVREGKVKAIAVELLSEGADI